MLGGVLFLLATGGAVATDPFSNYLTAVKAQSASSAFETFAVGCGLQPKRQQPIYGVSVGESWERTSDLAKAVHDTESDFFSSAEVWVQDGKARVVVLWSLSLDVGSEVRTLACLADNGSVKNLQVTNWSIPVDSSPGGWQHEQFVSFDGTGRAVSKRGYFVDSSGRPTPKPKMDEDEKGSFEWVPNSSLIAKIQTDLLGNLPKLGTR